MTNPFTHAETIRIAATPSEVYDVVSDVTRTGEWSPICKECWWDAGGGARVGAWFTGRNVTETRQWQTRSQVIAAEPGRAFAWSVGEGYVVWRYDLREADGGTELIESWEFTEAGRAFFVEKYGDDAPAEIAERTSAALAGIPATLAAIKRIVEARSSDAR